MRLALKFTIALLFGMGIVLAIHAYLVLRDEISLYEIDVQGDQREMGKAIGLAVAKIWSVDGEKRAIEFIREVDQKKRNVQLRWIWLDAQRESPHYPRYSPE